MRNQKGLALFISVLIIFLGISACSSGGGDDGGDDGGGGGALVPTNMISADEVDSIVRSVGDTIPGCSAPAVAASSASVDAIESISLLAREMADQIQGKYVSQMTRSAPVQADINPISGNCSSGGGTLDINLTTDEETGAFSGGLTFTSFCFEADSVQTTVNGGASFSGVVGLDDEGFLESLTFSAGTTGSGISIASDNVSANVTITGLSIAMGPVGSDGFSLTVALASAGASVTQDGQTENITISNLSLSLSGSDTDGSTASLAATITTSDGIVVVSTPTAVTVNDQGGITGGVILISGANDTAIQITYAGSGYNFNVTADTDGDGGFDDYSSTLDCSDVQNQLPL